MKPHSELADAIPHTPTSDHPPMACNTCQSLTARVTLANHGGRCYQCFVDYCRAAHEPVQKRPDTQTVADMKTRVKDHHRFDAGGVL